MKLTIYFFLIFGEKALDFGVDVSGIQ